MSILTAVVVVAVGGLPAARDEEPHMYCGKTAVEWIETLRDPNRAGTEHRRAAEALGNFGAEAGAAVPDLVEAIHRGRRAQVPASVPSRGRVLRARGR